jgi:hypothetical protein
LGVRFLRRFSLRRGDDAGVDAASPSTPAGSQVGNRPAREVSRQTESYLELGTSEMPFSFISSVLGICFALVWAFVAIMIVRLSQMAARHDREAR